MYKTKREYLTEINLLYEELRKITYGEKKGGNCNLPPSSSHFYVYAKRLYETVWDMIKAFPDSVNINVEELVHDSERDILHELTVPKEDKDIDFDQLSGTLEKYYSRIGSDLNLFLNS